MNANQRSSVAPTNGRRRKVVALLVETSNEYARGLLRGIVGYVREHRPWSTYLAEQARGDEPPAWLDHWQGDGIIARIENPRIADVVTRSGLPVVDVSAANLVPGIPWVETDDQAIAKAGFEHLIERGFRSLAFVGDERFNWSNWRRDQFVGLARERKIEPAVMHATVVPRAGHEWIEESTRLARWLVGLPKPVGVMACYDLLGRQVLEACRQASLAVPDDVAVIGVDDDELICELSDPPLSSVVPDAHRTGYEAAALLDRMMGGEIVEAKPHLVPPLGMMPRASSDVLAIDDPDITAAVRFIREHALDGIDVNDVVERVPLSRRVLESRFKKLVGRSPHEEIDRVQINRAQELLRETDLSLVEVSAKIGFPHAEYLSVVFKKRVGMTPREYRKQHRGR
ncbi:XylR family transcriptional regulator [Humisphaera borealis]|uniref:DNA-binding transcriptional regulator n=1 Tax=Humisphaera borealis TaxID=2807512 RepID=A0A7M2WU60_9BACT|nr:DNA-binding transcriptional regulator [Humisphaera borealis]QOV88702.1 DNA-binding transcriptional regulator [Humisphaera borealis]